MAFNPTENTTLAIIEALTESTGEIHYIKFDEVFNYISSTIYDSLKNQFLPLSGGLMTGTLTAPEIQVLTTLTATNLTAESITCNYITSTTSAQFNVLTSYNVTATDIKTTNLKADDVADLTAKYAQFA